MKHRPLAKKVVSYSHIGARHVMYVNAESNTDAHLIAHNVNVLLQRFPNHWRVSYIL